MSIIVVNPQLEYWGEITLKKAITTLYKEKAVVLAHNDIVIGYDRNKNPIYYPLVIQLKRLVIAKWKSARVNYSHTAVFDRDDNFCQYWHWKTDELVKEPFKYKCNETDRTIDHIIPVSRGGRKNDFKNTVCSCRYCNEIIKRNKTPDESGLKLIRTPLEPTRKIGDRIIKHFVFNPKKESHVAFAKIRPDLI
jgi:hypothetical protein